MLTDLDQSRISPWAYTPRLNLMETFWGWTWVMILSLASLLNSRSCRYMNMIIILLAITYSVATKAFSQIPDYKDYNSVKIIEINVHWDDQCWELTYKVLCIQCINVSIVCVCNYTSTLMVSDCGFCSVPSSGETDSVQFKGNEGPRQR